MSYARENDPKSIKTVGYNPSFLAKNDPKCRFLHVQAKIIEYNLKGVKMTYNVYFKLCQNYLKSTETIKMGRKSNFV
jgi:hypothetical protein